MKHTCESRNPGTWDTCEACKREAFSYRLDRDYEPKIDSCNGLFAQLDEITYDQIHELKMFSHYPPRTRSRLE
jgi:hypothetical protein